MDQSKILESRIILLTSFLVYLTEEFVDKIVSAAFLLLACFGGVSPYILVEMHLAISLHIVILAN
jgi:hypothetical protein